MNKIDSDLVPPLHFFSFLIVTCGSWGISLSTVVGPRYESSTCFTVLFSVKVTRMAVVRIINLRNDVTSFNPRSEYELFCGKLIEFLISVGETINKICKLYILYRIFPFFCFPFFCIILTNYWEMEEEIYLLMNSLRRKLKWWKIKIRR